jgi:hypothetical protein
MNPIANSETIEIEMVAGITKYKLPSQTNFRDKKILAVDSYYFGTMDKSPLGKALCNTNAMKRAFVTLSAGGKEVIKSQPIVSMQNSFQYGRKFEIAGHIINHDKSYVEFGDSTYIVAGEVVMLTFYW